MHFKKKYLQTKSLKKRKNFKFKKRKKLKLIQRKKFNWLRRNSKSFKFNWRWKKRKLKSLKLIAGIKMKAKLKRFKLRRKLKKLIKVVVKTRNKHLATSNVIVLTTRIGNKFISKRKIRRIFKRERFVKWLRFARRRKKFDPQVSVEEQEGNRVRCITKVGNRKIYRPLKRKFPKWWKLSRNNKQWKKRRRDKKIAGFRWIYRSRNSIEPRLTRRRKFYSRHKRSLDFVEWKLNNNKSNLVKYAMKRDHYDHVFSSLVGVNKVGAGIRRNQRISRRANVARYNKLNRNRNIGKNEIVSNSVSSFNTRENNNEFGVSVMRYSINKRYRNRKLNNYLLNSSISSAQNYTSLFERNISTRKVGSLLSKQRLNVFNDSRYAMFLTKGRCNQ